MIPTKYIRKRICRFKMGDNKFHGSAIRIMAEDIEKYGYANITVSISDVDSKENGVIYVDVYGDLLTQEWKEYSAKLKEASRMKLKRFFLHNGFPEEDLTNDFLDNIAVQES